jgi:hypothetical protein
MIAANSPSTNSARTPSSRTGSRLVNPPSAASAAASMAAGSWVGSASARPCVLVKNGANRTFTTILAASRPSAATSSLTIRAIPATSSATCAQSTKLSWNVTSRLRDRASQGSSVTRDRSMPRPSCTSHGPIVGPKCGANSRGDAAASSATVMIDNSASRLAVLDPTPHSASVGLSPRISSQLELVILNTPAGLPNPVAILA